MSNWKEKLRNRTQQAAENRESQGSDKKFILDMNKINLPLWTPRTGAGEENKNKIDIMPWRVTQKWYKNLRGKNGTPLGFEVGDFDYKLEVSRHAYVGAANDSFICLRESFGKNDVVCEDMFAEWKKRTDGDSSFDEKKAKNLQPKLRCFYIIWDYNEEEKGYQLWEMSYHLFEKYLLEAITNNPNGEIVPWDLEDGYIIEFSCREKQIGKHTFPEQSGDIIFTPREEAFDEAFIKKNIPSLDAALIIPTQEDIYNSYHGLDIEQESTENTEKTKETSEASEASETRSSRNSRPTRGSRERTGPPVEAQEEKKEDAPKWDEGGDWSGMKCPGSSIFGKDCNQTEDCKKEICDQKTYEACMKAYQKLSKKPEKESRRPRQTQTQAQEQKQEQESEKASTEKPRRRRR
jgi:hypothetical protein